MLNQPSLAWCQRELRLGRLCARLVPARASARQARVTDRRGDEEAYARFIDVFHLLRHARRTAGQCPSGHESGSARRPAERWIEVAHLSRELLRTSLQPVDANHAAERQSAQSAMDVPDDAHSKFPDDTAVRR